MDPAAPLAPQVPSAPSVDGVQASTMDLGQDTNGNLAPVIVMLTKQLQDITCTFTLRPASASHRDRAAAPPSWAPPVWESRIYASRGTDVPSETPSTYKSPKGCCPHFLGGRSRSRMYDDHCRVRGRRPWRFGRLVSQPEGDHALSAVHCRLPVARCRRPTGVSRLRG